MQPCKLPTHHPVVRYSATLAVILQINRRMILLAVLFFKKTRPSDAAVFDSGPFAVHPRFPGKMRILLLMNSAHK